MCLHLMKYLLLLFLCVISLTTNAQLKPGFDIQEYLELLRISRQQVDTLKGDLTPMPQQYKRIYRSAVGPLNNRWEMWISNKTAVISIRGTTDTATSWLENFYAAMVPATGELHINDKSNFDYHLAENPRAAVHTGWLLGMANVAESAVPQIRKLVSQQGIKNFIIMGHSQGAAIAYLLRSHFAWLEKQGEIPHDLIFKVYASAPPKPGNTYYAYDFDYLTRGGWCLSVINAADWVPETPFSIQTVNDYNALNPFNKIDESIKGQNFFVKLYIKHVYNRLKKPGIRAVKNNQKYLGYTLYKFIKKSLPQFQEPVYAPTNLYTHCGVPVMLMPDADYQRKFPDSSKNIFIHHLFWPYYYLAEREYSAK